MVNRFVRVATPSRILPRESGRIKLNRMDGAALRASPHVCVAASDTARAIFPFWFARNQPHQQKSRLACGQKRLRQFALIGAWVNKNGWCQKGLERNDVTSARRSATPPTFNGSLRGLHNQPQQLDKMSRCRAGRPGPGVCLNIGPTPDKTIS